MDIPRKCNLIEIDGRMLGFIRLDVKVGFTHKFHVSGSRLLQNSIAI